VIPPTATVYNTAVLLYYITDRRQFPGDEAQQRRALLVKIAEAARGGVDYIQLREKDLSARELELLAREAVQVVRENPGYSKLETRNSKLLINSRLDVALACGADGVHLPAGDISAGDARATWDISTRIAKREMRNAVIGVSCHSLAEVLSAESHGADFAVFGPVFEKSSGAAPSAVRAGVGLAALREVCHRGLPPDPKTEAVASGVMPVLALGGVTVKNARACSEAGAAGVAGIRLFQEHEIAVIVGELHSVGSGHLKLETRNSKRS
jgi:thiamine-phosphate pyrophosphorylase